MLLTRTQSLLLFMASANDSFIRVLSVVSVVLDLLEVAFPLCNFCINSYVRDVDVESVPVTIVTHFNFPHSARREGEVMWHTAKQHAYNILYYNLSDSSVFLTFSLIVWIIRCCCCCSVLPICILFMPRYQLWIWFSLHEKRFCCECHNQFLTSGRSFCCLNLILKF